MKEEDDVLFIGGVLDGQTVKMETTQRSWRAIVRQPITLSRLLVSRPDAPVAVEYNDYREELINWRRADGSVDRRRLFVFVGIPIDEAFKMLIEGYRKPPMLDGDFDWAALNRLRKTASA